MEQPGGRTLKSQRKPVQSILTFWVCVLSLDVLVVLLYRYPTDGQKFDLSFVLTVIIGTALAATVVTYFRLTGPRDADGEAQARQRVRQAEDKLSDALRGGQETYITIHGDTTIYQDAIAPGASDQVSEDESISLKRRDDGLTLAALWDVTHGRLDLYHQIVTGQARRSFGAAQVAMAIGFVLLVGFAVLAAEAKTTAAAVSAGGLGAVGAAFAAYIGKTFIRSQESAASHLRAYFDQPLELSRYLAAERLLADAKELTADQRAAIVSSLVESIATAGQHDKAKDAKPRSRQARRPA
jgi:hypothetical protein